jgi:hypothetical protein
MNEPLINDTLAIKREFLNLKPAYSKDNKEYIFMAKELKDMGFELEMIDMCFCFFNIKTIEQAIQYMTKDNGVWQHMYIESENKLCVICNENSDHLNYIISLNNTSSQIRDRLNNSKSSFSSSNFLNKSDMSNLLKKNISNLSNINVNTSNTGNNNVMIRKLDSDEIDIAITIKSLQHKNVVCKVCEIEYALKECFKLNCNHNFCLDCWYYYLEQKISTSDVNF